jgi:galactose-1-phosphate uridylyltransferase
MTGKTSFKKTIRSGVEHRTDPLTGEQCRINPKRLKMARQPGAELDLKELISRSREHCPFCPERIDSATPPLPKHLFPQERLSLGRTKVFSNLNPFGQYHAVATLTEEHYLGLDQFTEDMLLDNLKASHQYYLTVYEKEGRTLFPVYLWNYMPPSAGSMLHPHVQLMVEEEGLPRLAEILRMSKQYFDRWGTSFWEDLVQEERRLGERFVYGDRSLAILASFAPRGFREIRIIFREASSLTDLSAATLADFARCLVTLLHAYKQMGVGSFNLMSFSSAIGLKLPHYRLNFTLISRPFPKGLYTNDTGPLERLCNVWVVDTLPEDIAREMRQSFPPGAQP